MHFYNDWAQRILAGGMNDPGAFYGLPGYPYLLAILYKLFGFNPFIPGLLQAFLEGGTAVLIYHLTLHICRVERIPNSRLSSPFRDSAAIKFPQLVGAGAALGWAFYVPAQAYSVILMPTAWLVFVFWFVVWRIVRNENAPTRTECLLLGLLIGLTAIAVATILFLIPLVIAALVLKPKLAIPKRGFFLGVALLLLGVAAGTSPCWIHNYIIARDPVFLSAHSGINFWIGNNPDANGYPRFPPGLRAGQTAMLEDSITSAESAAGHSLKRAEVSAYWSAKAKNYITHHFLEWLKLLLTKLRNLWSAFQYDDLSIITNLREHRVILPGLYFGAVAAFGLSGILIGWWAAPKSRWIIAALVLHVAALLSVFITERYRLPIVPGLFVFAVFGLSIFWRSFVAREYRLVLSYLALLVGSTILVSWPQRGPSLWALDAYNSGWQALESGNFVLAENKLQRAYAYVPNNPEINFALGNLRFAQGRNEAAEAFYRDTLTLDRQHRGALNNLGVLALDERRLDDAEMFFRLALTYDPNNAKVHFLLAKVLLTKGNRQAAQFEIDSAIRLKPGQHEFEQLREQIQLNSR